MEQNLGFGLVLGLLAVLKADQPDLLLAKGQTISEWIYEVIVSPKIRTKNSQAFCPHYTGPDIFSFVFWEKQ